MSDTFTRADAVENGEFELLLLATRSELSPREESRLGALLDSDLDWDAVLDMTRRNYIAPLVNKALLNRLSGKANDAIPPKALERLRVDATTAARRGLLLVQETMAVLELFERRGIPVIVMKGPLFAERIYGNIALRDSYDVDILVHRGLFGEARKLLLESGYRPEYAEGALKRGFRMRREGELNFIRQGGPPVELHWKLAPSYVRFPVPMQDIWARSRRVPFMGRSVLTLDDADMLLSLCVHNGGKHYWMALRWIRDLAGLIEQAKDRIPWEEVCERATATGCLRLLYVGVLLANGVMETEVPEDVLRRAAGDEGATNNVRRIVRRLAAGSEDEKWDNAVRRCVTYFRLRERFMDRLSYLPFFVNKLFRPTDGAQVRSSGDDGDTGARRRTKGSGTFQVTRAVSGLTRVPSLLRKYARITRQVKKGEKV